MAVDPVEPPKIAQMLASGQTLAAIATTHHHSDHSAGNAELHKLFPEAKVYGFDDRIPAITNKIGDGECFALGKLRIEGIHCPCHTTGSISYVVHDDATQPTEQAVFTGDTLFLAGCGKFFEGEAIQMYEILYHKIGRLSPSTKLFVGHEYTIKNLEFGAKVEPSNQKIALRLQNLRAELESNGFVLSVPGDLSEEWETNPFMRLESTEICQITATNDPIQTMRVLREMKNNF